MATLYAKPTAKELKGFDFETYNDFDAQASDLEEIANEMGIAWGTEEFEFSIAEGNRAETELFEICNVNAINLDYFIDISNLEPSEQATAFWLIDNCNYSPRDALHRYHEVDIYEGSALEAATTFFDNMYDHLLPEFVRGYIDYESFSNDMERGGDLCEFVFDGTTWSCVNANSF